MFENLNLEISRQDFIGLTGENGSGKSTLIKIMVGEIEATSGSVSVLGTPVESFKNWHNIGYVPQMGTRTNRDFPATAKEIVMLSLYSEIGFMRKPGKKHKEKAIKALEEVGMGELQNRQIKNLSGGQYQRVMIAKALVSDPCILILDEPTSGVDHASKESLYNLLKDLNKKGMTILLITHDLEDSEKYLNRMVRLEHKSLREIDMVR